MTGNAWVAAIAALIIGLGGGYMFGASNSGGSMEMQGMSGTNSSAALHTAMRKLWADHVFWTREYITSFAAGNTAEAQADATRLLKNQEDIGAAVAQYYGADAGNQLT